MLVIGALLPKLLQLNSIHWLTQLSLLLLPLLLLLAAAISIAFRVYVGRRRADRRRQAMQAFAREHGWQFYPRADRNLLQVTDGFRAVYSVDMRPRIENVMSRTRRGVTVALFDFCYYQGSNWESWARAFGAAATDSRPGPERLKRRSVACVWSDTLQLPYFTLSRERGIDRLLTRLGAQDIDFEAHPRFSEHYRLQGDDVAAVRKLFSPDLLGFFESRTSLLEHDIVIEGENNCLMLHPHNVDLPPTELTWLIDETEAAFGAFVRLQKRRSKTSER